MNWVSYLFLAVHAGAAYLLYRRWRAGWANTKFWSDQ